MDIKDNKKKKRGEWLYKSHNTVQVKLKYERKNKKAKKGSERLINNITLVSLSIFHI